MDDLPGETERLVARLAAHSGAVLALTRRALRSGRDRQTKRYTYHVFGRRVTDPAPRHALGWHTLWMRRDDLLTVQVDGTKGTAVAGLRDCVVQHASATPRPVWNPDVESPIKYLDGWTEFPSV